MAKPQDWITVNGAHVPLDEEGEPKGETGRKIAEETRTPRKLSSLEPDTDRFSALLAEHEGDFKKAAHAYYREQLQGKFVEVSLSGESANIHFTGGGWNELKKNMANDPVKAALVPSLPDIIGTGKVTKEEPAHPHKGINGFYSFRKKASTAEGEKEVIVDVAERLAEPLRYSAYSLTREGSPAYAQRQEKEGAPSKPAPGRNRGGKNGAESGDTADGKIIMPDFEVVNVRFAEGGRNDGDSTVNTDNLTFDTATVRHVDENGYLHVAVSHISKETVNQYRGVEIIGWQQLGLDPQHLYAGYRKGAELEKAAPTFNNLPLLRDHHHVDAELPQREFWMGTTGSDAAFTAPYLDNSLTVWDADAIRDIETGRRMELSCSYRYVPDFTPGVFEGVPYDFVMTDIRGNHVALVEKGRAGRDVTVADAQINLNIKERIMAKGKDWFKRMARLVLAQDAAPDAPVEEAEVDKAAQILEAAQEIIDLHKDTPQGPQDAPKGGDEDPAPENKTGEAVPAGPEEDVKKALDACGLDAANPDFQKAFAAGVAYGEKKEKEEPDRLDREHEAAGIKKEELVKAASDAAMSRFQLLADAQREVRPFVGEVSVNLAADSADAIYGAALDALGVDKAVHPKAAWRSVFQVVSRQRAGASVATASDAAIPAESPLSRIKQL